VKPSLTSSTVFWTLALTTLPSVGSAQRRDPLIQDPSGTDRAYLAVNRAVVISNAGSRMIGSMLIADGRGPHNVVVLLHGFPGHERNLDLAQAIRRAGWNVLTFSYRGSWGSEGSYSFSSVLDDVRAALAFVRTSDSSYRVSTDHVVLVGHSMGGWAALMTAARDSQIDAVASIAGWNIAVDSRDLTDPAKYAATVKDLAPDLWLLRGTTPEVLLREQMAHVDEWDLVRAAPLLASKPVLLIAGERDVAVPLVRHHAPLVAELKRLNAKRLTTVIFDSGHGFSDKRIALTRAILTWLDTLDQQ
jgi:uncharacterized protein